MNPALDLTRGWLHGSRASKFRTMREFAESEIIIPDGPRAGDRYSCDTQPYSRLWFEQVDSGFWTRFAAVACTQSGKSLTCFIIPALYHLFEVKETVICGVPTLDVAADKWNEDIKPAIEASRYRDELPVRGDGSRGGKVESIKFRNGATLRFMTGGGGDKSRAAFTSRVVVITEVDGMDEAKSSSREGDPVSQIEARTRAFSSSKRIYLECTASIEKGRIWTEYTNGTQSTILLPCRYCHGWVAPEREHLIGWQDAENEQQAKDESYFYCPGCGEQWTEQDRVEANRAARLIHQGQELDATGEVVGEAPRTSTLGFRWSAVHNLFWTPGDIGQEEWHAPRSQDPEAKEKELRQYTWALPHVPTVEATVTVEAEAIMRRQGSWDRDELPPDTETITAGIDLGSRLLHWSAVAWRRDCKPHVLAYDREEVPGLKMGLEAALSLALSDLRGRMLAWPTPPSVVFIDAGWQPDVVHAFLAKFNDGIFHAAKGFGASQYTKGTYTKPKSTGAFVLRIGRNWHLARLAEQRRLVEIDADWWKTWTQRRLTTEPNQPGSMTLFNGQPAIHRAYAQHLTAEHQETEFVRGKGEVLRWIRDRQDNHWFDSLYLACAASDFAGVVLPSQQQPQAESGEWFKSQKQATADDGGGWFARQKRR